MSSLFTLRGNLEPSGDLDAEVAPGAGVEFQGSVEVVGALVDKGLGIDVRALIPYFEHDERVNQISQLELIFQASGSDTQIDDLVVLFARLAGLLRPIGAPKRVDTLLTHYLLGT